MIKCACCWTKGQHAWKKAVSKWRGVLVKILPSNAEANATLTSVRWFRLTKFMIKVLKSGNTVHSCNENVWLFLAGTQSSNPCKSSLFGAKAIICKVYSRYRTMNGCKNKEKHAGQLTKYNVASSSEPCVVQKLEQTCPNDCITKCKRPARKMLVCRISVMWI